MSVPRWLDRILTHYGVPYEERRHPPVNTASELAQVEHVSGYRVAKTVLLNDHGHPLAIVLPACARLDLDRVRELLGKPDLQLASEEEVARWFHGCTPGAVPPVRIRGDECLVMDRSLAHLGHILFAAGSQDTAVLVRFRDWYRAVHPGVGRFTEGNGHTNGHQSRMVLIVEDESDTNNLLCHLLERAGYRCRGVEAGREALTAATEIKPAAILLDLMLPDMSGFEVCEQLGRVGPLKRVPVIFVSALGDERSRERGSQLGAEGYLTKPFRPDALVAELNEVMADAAG